MVLHCLADLYFAMHQFQIGFVAVVLLELLNRD